MLLNPKILFCLCLLLGVGRCDPIFLHAAEPSGLIISEFMAANEITLEDGHGDSPDWIELYNNSEASISLDHWALTDDPEALFKWILPTGLQLQPHAHMLLFASNKDEQAHEDNFPYLDSAGFYHTNFSLRAEGEYLALTRPDGQLACEFRPEYPTQYKDLSYGWGDHPDDSRLLGHLLQPTPGKPNSVIGMNLGPSIDSVFHEPMKAAADDDLVITAAIAASAESLQIVMLSYRVNYDSETVVLMNDHGNERDAEAGDQLYTGVIPASAFEPGDMVRWAVQAINHEQRMSRYPLFPTPKGSPEYCGTLIRTPAQERTMPVLFWFLPPGKDSAANSRAGTQASLYYHGEFYDNVFVRIRGGSIAGLHKKSYKFEFSTGHLFRFAEEFDRVDTININTTYTDKSYVRQCLAFEVYDCAGVPASESFPIRVQRNGEFFSVGMFIEQPDRHLLEREGLDADGALYKMYNGVSSSGNAQKKTRRWDNKDDLKTLVSGINMSNEEKRTAFIFDHIDIPAALNFLAASVLVQNDDDSKKNYYLYRDTNGTGQWRLLPWDLDLTFGKHYMSKDSILTDILWADKDRILGGRNQNVAIWPSHPFVDTRQTPGNRSWNRLTDALLTTPRFVEMYQRRLRTLMDDILQPPTTPPGNRILETRLDELAANIASSVAQDRSKWGWYGESQTLDQAIDALKTEYLDVRRSHLYVTHSARMSQQYSLPGSFSANIPDAQPVNASVEIGSIESEPDSGNQDEEFVQLINPHGYAVDISGWSLVDAVTFEFPPGTVVPALDALYVSPNVKVFRARNSAPTGGQGLLVVGNFKGHLSPNGETVTLVDNFGVKVTELAYDNSLSSQ